MTARPVDAMRERAEVVSRIRAALAAADFPRALEALAGIAPRKRLKPLYSALLDREERVRRRAVVALGTALAAVAAAHPEEGRELWRNLMWRLSEESGAIGWGIPEVMGETLARSPLLAGEYARILVGYVRDLPGAATSYLDHPELRRGAWWGIARLAEARPDLARQAGDALPAALKDADPAIRGLACLVAARTGPPHAPEVTARLAALADDTAVFPFSRDDRVETARVADLARLALEGEGG